MTNFVDTSAAVQTVSQLPEIISNLLLLLSEKEKEVIIKRFNLDEKGKKTLEEIGQKFSVTRERIRQIEKNALAKMKRNVFNTPITDLHEFVTNTVRSHGGIFKKEKLREEITAILPKEISVNASHIDLTLALHNEVDTKGNTIDYFPFLKTKDLKENTIKELSHKLVKQLKKHGDTKNISKINKDLQKNIAEAKLTSQSLKSLIDIDKRLTIIKENQVGLMQWRHINPRTLRDKIQYIFNKHKKPLHFLEITEKIQEAKFDARKVNTQAVHNELIRHGKFILIGRGIYALQDWGYQKGTVADVITRILKKHDELSEQEIIDKVLQKRKVKKITILLSLKNNKNIERVGRKQYRYKA